VPSGDEFVVVYSSPLTSGATAAPAAAPSASQAVEVTWTAYRSRAPQPSPSPSDPGSPVPVRVARAFLGHERLLTKQKPRQSHPYHAQANLNR